MVSAKPTPSPTPTKIHQIPCHFDRREKSKKLNGHQKFFTSLQKHKNHYSFIPKNVFVFDVDFQS